MYLTVLGFAAGIVLLFIESKLLRKLTAIRKKNFPIDSMSHVRNFQIRYHIGLESEMNTSNARRHNRAVNLR